MRYYPNKAMESTSKLVVVVAILKRFVELLRNQSVKSKSTIISANKSNNEFLDF